MQSEATTQQAPKKSILGPLICILGGVGALSMIVTHTQPTKEEIAASKAAAMKREATRAAAREDSIRVAIKNQEENTVGANALLKAYKADESRANLKYKGRNLYIEGKINQVITYRYGNLITFTEREFGPSIVCSVKDKNEVSHLKAGDYVAVYGLCQEAKSDVHVENAHVVPTMAAWKAINHTK